MIQKSKRRGKSLRRSTKDYYKLLGVSRKATAGQIKKAYHRMAMRFHPDHNPGDKAAENRFKDINEAYEVLADEKKRFKYENILRYQSSGFDFIEKMARKAQRKGSRGMDFQEVKNMFSKGKGSSSSSEGLFEGMGISAFSDVLDILFSRSSEEKAERKKKEKSVKGEDVHFSFTISASLARKGGKTKVVVPIEESCSKCKGSGASQGTKAPICSDCKGRGEIPQTLGNFAINRPCSSCLGRGRIIAKPCPECSGKGVVDVKKDVSVKIPPRVKEGQKIRLKGMGMAGKGKLPPGDLYLKVGILREDEEEIRREEKSSGSSRVFDVEINPVMAMLGGKTRVELPNKKKLKVRVPPDCKDGTVLRLPRAGENGLDLRIRLRIVGEDGLSEKTRNLMKELN